MAFHQVKDLLQWIIDFHEKLGSQYRHLSEAQTDERMKMTLSFLADREERMHHSMVAYRKNADSGLLGTWLIDSQEFVHPHLLNRIPKCLDCQDVQDILANVLTAHQTLKDMYRLRAQLAQVPEEKKLFEELADNQEAEARLQTRDVARFELC